MLFRAERGESMRGWREAAITIAAVLLWLGPAAAKDARPEIAYLVVDAASGTVLAAQNATQSRYSASVTKAMTAYMVFEALDGERLALDQRVAISAKAAAQPPTELGLRTGGTETVKLLLEALIVRSANDAAVAPAEAVSVSAAAFATALPPTAPDLGMTPTRKSTE